MKKKKSSQIDMAKKRALEAVLGLSKEAKENEPEFQFEQIYKKMADHTSDSFNIENDGWQSIVQTINNNNISTAQTIDEIPENFQIAGGTKLPFVISGIVAALAALFIIIVKIQEPIPARSEKAIIAFVKGDVKIIQGNAAEKIVYVKKVVSEGDVVTTGKKSLALIQLGNFSIIRLQQNSEIKITSFISGKNTWMALTKGTVLLKVDKLEAGENYQIQTLTGIAGVRGTVFSVKIDKTKMTTNVLEGKVIIKSLKTGDKTSITENQTGDISINDGKIKTGKISKNEEANLLSLAKQNIIKDIEKKSTEELEKIFSELSVADKGNPEGQKQISVKFKTLREIRKKYKRVSRITLFNGKKIEGAIITRGKLWQVMTTNGIIKIKKEDVKNTEILK